MNEVVLDAIRTRRVARAMTEAPVERDQLQIVLDSARYAPHAGNRRLHRYVVVTRPAVLRAVRMMSPGMLQRPTAAIIVCVDWDTVCSYGFRQQTPDHTSTSAPRLRRCCSQPTAWTWQPDRSPPSAAPASRRFLAYPKGYVPR